MVELRVLGTIALHDGVKSRGICPSCNARRMCEVAAHLTDHVLPHVPARQWVLSVPKRLRPYLRHDVRVAGAVLRNPNPE